MKTRHPPKVIRPEKPSTKSSFLIENIEELRQSEGIDDVELHQEIRRLRVGDAVKLTFLHETKTSETLLVRISSIERRAFRGTLAQKPTAKALAILKLGASVDFTAANIHSVVAKTPVHESADS